jgi:hypothetical protein
VTKATSKDKALNRLYAARRKAATQANWAATSYQRRKGYLNLEAIENQLSKLDADGDWRHEGFNFDTNQWEVNR